jgi:hypothetical protein
VGRLDGRSFLAGLDGWGLVIVDRCVGRPDGHSVLAGPDGHERRLGAVIVGRWVGRLDCLSVLTGPNRRGQRVGVWVGDERRGWASNASTPARVWVEGERWWAWQGV